MGSELILMTFETSFIMNEARCAFEKGRKSLQATPALTVRRTEPGPFRFHRNAARARRRRTRRKQARQRIGRASRAKTVIRGG